MRSEVHLEPNNSIGPFMILDWNYKPPINYYIYTLSFILKKSLKFRLNKQINSRFPISKRNCSGPLQFFLSALDGVYECNRSSIYLIYIF